MPKLTQLTLPDGTILFIEATESVESPPNAIQEMRWNSFYCQWESG